jgi:hypothetical protein
MPQINEFTSGGSSVVADNKLQALQLLVIQANQAESRRNRDNKTNQTTQVSFALTADASVLFTSTVTIPAKMERVGTKIELVPEKFFADSYFPFIPGSGDLADYTHGMEALLGLAEECTYLEKGIDPNVVVTQADQVVVTPDYENGQYVITTNLPIDVSIDDVTGAVGFNVFDYLRILQFQAA